MGNEDLEWLLKDRKLSRLRHKLNDVQSLVVHPVLYHLLSEELDKTGGNYELIDLDMPTTKLRSKIGFFLDIQRIGKEIPKCEEMISNLQDSLCLGKIPAEFVPRTKKLVRQLKEGLTSYKEKKRVFQRILSLKHDFFSDLYRIFDIDSVSLSNKELGNAKRIRKQIKSHIFSHKIPDFLIIDKDEKLIVPVDAKYGSHINARQTSASNLVGLLNCGKPLNKFFEAALKKKLSVKGVRILIEGTEYEPVDGYFIKYAFKPNLKDEIRRIVSREFLGEDYKITYLPDELRDILTDSPLNNCINSVIEEHLLEKIGKATAGINPFKFGSNYISNLFSKEFYDVVGEYFLDFKFGFRELVFNPMMECAVRMECPENAERLIGNMHKSFVRCYRPEKGVKIPYPTFYDVENNKYDFDEIIRKIKNKRKT